jgi:hypothetical protein
VLGGVNYYDPVRYFGYTYRKDTPRSIVIDNTFQVNKDCFGKILVMHVAPKDYGETFKRCIWVNKSAISSLESYSTGWNANVIPNTNNNGPKITCVPKTNVSAL